MIIKFKTSVLFNKMGTHAKIISFDLDEYFIVRGHYVELLTNLQNGVTLDYILSKLQSLTHFEEVPIKDNLKHFIDYLKDWALIDKVEEDSLTTLKKKSIENILGSIEAFTFEKIDYDIFALKKAVDENP